MISLICTQKEFNKIIIRFQMMLKIIKIIQVCYRLFKIKTKIKVKWEIKLRLQGLYSWMLKIQIKIIINLLRKIKIEMIKLNI